jgi:hypothetical protein
MTWFVPFFRRRVEAALDQPAPNRQWTVIVDAIPTAATGLRAVAEEANRWYYRRLGPVFMHAWENRV